MQAFEQESFNVRRHIDHRSDRDEKLLEELFLLILDERFAEQGYHLQVGVPVVTVIEACLLEVNLHPLIILQESHLTHFRHFLAPEPNLLVKELNKARMFASLEMGDKAENL